MANDLVIAYIVSGILLLIFTLFCGIVAPLLFFRCFLNERRPLIGPQRIGGKRKLYLSLLICFGGGVLFATAFVHILQDVNEGFEAFSENGNKSISQEIQDKVPFNGYPMAGLVISLGFFMVYLIEELVDYYNVTSHVQNENQTHNQNGNGEVQNQDDNQNEHFPDFANGNIFSSVMILIALSIHSIFEGLAIGIQDTSTEVYQLLLGIAVHKLVIAFTIGVNVLSDTNRENTIKLPINLIISQSIFSIAAPLGLLIGSITKHVVSPGVSGFINALAMGTIVYIVFFEILFKERQKKLPGLEKISGLLKFLATFIGFVIMSLFQLLDKD